MRLFLLEPLDLEPFFFSSLGFFFGFGPGFLRFFWGGACGMITASTVSESASSSTKATVSIISSSKAVATANVAFFFLFFVFFCFDPLLDFVLWVTNNSSSEDDSSAAADVAVAILNALPERLWFGVEVPLAAFSATTSLLSTISELRRGFMRTSSLTDAPTSIASSSSMLSSSSPSSSSIIESFNSIEVSTTEWYDEDALDNLLLDI